MSEPSGSAIVVDTFAVLSIDPVADGETCTVKVNVADAPGASEARVQVIVPAACPHVKPGPAVWVALTKVVFAGTLSVSDTSAAVEGPLLVSVTV